MRYDKNIKSLRKICVNESYEIFGNSRIAYGQIGTVVSKNKKYILVSFNGEKVKVYPDPELFAHISKKRKI